MKSFIKIGIIFLIFSYNCVFAQSVSVPDEYEQVFFLARNLDQSGAAKEAFLEYKRYLFLQDYSEGIHQEEALLALSRLFENAKNYSQSLENIEAALNFNDSSENKIAHINLMRKIASEISADFESNKYLYKYRFMEDEAEDVKKLAWIAILENEIITEKFELYEENLSEFTNLYPDYFSENQLEELNKGLSKIYKFRPKNADLARILSIIPGLGQLYAGYPLDALNAFLLDGSLFALSAYSIGTLNFCDFILFEFAPTFRFYRGNFYNAEKEVNQYNYEKMLSLKNTILEILK